MKDVNLRQLKHLIFSHGYSIGKFAELIGVHRVTVSRWINGASAPNLATLRKISELLNEPISKILEGKE